MNFTRRRGAIAFFITLGVMLVGVAVTLNIGWIVLNERKFALAVLGIILFALLIAGLVLNTVFLVREVRRNERQDSFLNAVTHELKTPIASIRLYLETLQRRPLDDAQRQQFYTNMLADSDRLLATVEQVLKAGQLGQKDRQQDRVILDLAPLVEECITVTLQRHHLSADAIVFEPVSGGVDFKVMGIAEDLRIAILNVLDNAVKYSPDGVNVHCFLSMSNDAWCTLEIADTGVGLPQDQLKRIFRRFYRVPGRTMMRIKGTGLGLFLVRSIIRQHGGDALASSPGLNQGTTVTLKLPLSRSSSTEVAHLSAEEGR
jgi:signal transduction histidine kinase